MMERCSSGDRLEFLNIKQDDIDYAHHIQLSDRADGRSSRKYNTGRNKYFESSRTERSAAAGLNRISPEQSIGHKDEMHLGTQMSTFTAGQLSDSVTPSASNPQFSAANSEHLSKRSRTSSRHPGSAKPEDTAAGDAILAVTSPANHASKVALCVLATVLIGCGVGAGIGYGVYSIVSEGQSSAPNTGVAGSQKDDSSSTFPSSSVIQANSREDLPTTSSNSSTSTTTGVSIIKVNSEECGRRQASSDERVARIIGGDRTQISNHPWQASLWTNGHSCGGSIISSNWILSAAHCITPYPNAKDWVVFVGETDQNLMPTSAQRRTVTDVVSHKSYDEDTFENDIALLRLNQHLKLNSNVQTICLPSSSHTLPQNITCQITGWGALEEEGDVSRYLQLANVEIIDHQICNGDKWLTDLVLENMFCAGTEDGSRDACQGDSGGPLACYDNEERRYYLIGAVSWGIGCGEPRMPGVYTNVSQYVDWVDQSISSVESRRIGR